MEKKCEGCLHGFCGGPHGLLRWVLGLIIMVIVFTVGIAIGEFKSDVYGAYTRHSRSRMMWGGEAYGGQYYAPAMMGGFSCPVAAPAAPAATTSSKK